MPGTDHVDPAGALRERVSDEGRRRWQRPPPVIHRPQGPDGPCGRGVRDAVAMSTSLRSSAVSPSVAEYLRGWLNDQRDRCKPITWKSRRSHIDNYLVPALGERRLDELTSQDVSQLFEELLASGGQGGAPLSPSTVGGAGSTLRSALDDAVEGGLVDRNVARDVPSPRVSHPRDRTYQPAHTVWSVEEVRRFLDAIYDDPYRDLWVVALGTGLRRGELLGLRWPDVDLDEGQLRVARALRGGDDGPRLEELSGARVRTVTIDAFVADTLRWRRRVVKRRRDRAGSHWDDRWDLVFVDADGRPVEPGVVTSHFGRLVRRLDVPSVRLHDLRHTHAALLLEAGVAISTVSGRLGHASMGITIDTYADLLTRDEADVAGRFARLVYPEKERAVGGPSR